MRLSSLIVAAAVVLQLAACSSSSTGTGSGASGGTSGATTSGASGGGGGAGTCASACGYYLQCKAADTADNRALCNQRCVAQGYTAQQLSDFQLLDCPQAIVAIEGSSSSSGSSGGSSSCTGCVWDGSSCIYLTGSGGGYFPCDRSCCP